VPSSTRLSSQNDNASTSAQKGWSTGLEARAQATLPDFLLRQRWYPAKDAGRPEIAPKAVLPLSMSGLQAAISIWQVTPPNQAPMLLFVPLAVVPAETAADAQVIAAVPSEGEVTLRLVEAFSVDGFVRAWIKMTLRGDEVSGGGQLRGMQTTALAGAGLAPGDEFVIRRGSAEQSNTSIRIGERAILKVIRKLEEGVHPELEVGRFLTGEAGFDATPALLGWIELDGVAGLCAMTLSVLQAFVPNEGDGWTWVLERLARPEGHAASVEWLRRLGRRTAEMHRAFAKDTLDPAFRAEPVGNADRAAWIAAAEAMACRALDGLATTQNQLGPETQRLAEDLLTRRGALEAWLRSALSTVPAFAKTRHHGDYHLGQVLVAGDNAVIVDFEGEPLRPLAERRAKHAALRDVAGMLRSLAYAAAQAERISPGEQFSAWKSEAERAFLDGYFDAAAGGTFLPGDRTAADVVMRFFMLEKALYEVAYELANRPDWVAIPLRGVVALLDAEGERLGPAG
jgi:trehalose synthase-fused probable maltokinase